MAVSPFPGPAGGSQGCCEGARYCTTRQQNTHGIDQRELLYGWHPWAGRLVYIHEAVDKCGVLFRCSLDGNAARRWLEVPAWMFDRAAIANCEVSLAPRINLAALGALANILKEAGTLSQSTKLSAASGSHEANRGDFDATHASPSVRIVLRSAGDGEVEPAAVAGAARGNTPDAVRTDGATVARPRRRRKRTSPGGDAA